LIRLVQNIDLGKKLIFDAHMNCSYMPLDTEGLHWRLIEIEHLCKIN